MFTESQMKHARKVLDLLRREEVVHSQSYFMVPAKNGDSLDARSVSSWDTISAVTEAKNTNFCGTTLCIAGASAVLACTGAEIERNGWFHSGRKPLGLNREYASWLFYDADEEEAIRAVEAIAAGDANAFTELMP